MDALFQRGLGMQFDSVEGRARYFAQAKRDPTSVPLGAALSHAASTNLGVWGKEDALRNDCAQIMAFEVAHLARRRGLELTAPISTDDVLRTEAFDEAFVAARVEPDSLMQDVVTAMGIKGHIGRQANGGSPTPRVAVENAHQAVFDELVQRRQIPI